MIAYIAALKLPKLILWCYLAWYVAIVACYFDPMPTLWLSSLGIAGIIGFALTLATQQQNQRAESWIIFRLYLFPFCVSSYSALIKGKGFILLFPCELKSFLCGVLACVAVVCAHLICKRFSGRSYLPGGLGARNLQ